MILTGNKISLSLFNKENITNEYINWLNDKEAVEFSRQRHKKNTYESCLKFYLKLKKENNYFIKINLKTNNKFIGTMTYRFKNNQADIGIFIGDKNYWGKKIGYEAWKLSIDYLLPKVKKITAGCLKENLAMKKIMINSNMRFSHSKNIFNKIENLYEEFVYYEIKK